MSESTRCDAHRAAHGVQSFDTRSLFEALVVIAVLFITIGGGQIFGVGWLGPAFVLLAVVIANFLQHKRNQSWAMLGMGLHRKWWKTVVGAIIATILLLFAAGLVNILVLRAGLGQPDISRFGFIRTTWWGLPVMLTIVWTTAAFGEESCSEDS